MKRKIQLVLWAGLVVAGIGLWSWHRATRPPPPDCGGGVCCPVLPGISTLNTPTNPAQEDTAPNTPVSPGPK